MLISINIWTLDAIVHTMICSLLGSTHPGVRHSCAYIIMACGRYSSCSDEIHASTIFASFPTSSFRDWAAFQEFSYSLGLWVRLLLCTGCLLNRGACNGIVLPIYQAPGGEIEHCASGPPCYSGPYNWDESATSEGGVDNHKLGHMNKLRNFHINRSDVARK